MTTETTTIGPNGHDTHSSGAGPATCPYCGQGISRKEYREIQAKIADEERARVAKVEADLKTRFEREKAKTNAQKAVEIEKVKKDAAKAAEQQIKALKSSTETVIAARLEAQRIQFESRTTEAINAERAKMFGEKLKLEEQLADMQRRLQAKTAHQLGEPAEVDLFAALETAFPDDRVWRVVKGQPGPDVVVEILGTSGEPSSGQPIGKIVLDSKNHARWSNKFTTKLRADQLAEGADFAILSSNTMPAGEAQICLRDNVIVASPQRVVVLVNLLRRQIVENYRLKLGAEARNEKADRLYSFIMSPTCTDLLDRIVQLTADMADLDRTETTAHQKTWVKRADLIRAVQDIHREFTETVCKIIEGES
jgi:hypothetical protein